MSAIDDKYHALGGPNGFLGHPVDEGAGSHEMETRNGRGRFRDFQGGSVSWIPDGRIDVRQQIDQGMRCAQPRRAPWTAAVAPVPLPPERLGEAAAVMGRALVDDPLFVHVLTDPEQRTSGVPMMMESLLRIGLAEGEVWATPPPITGVAFWLSPAHPMITDEDRDAAGWREVGAAWGSEAFARFKAFAADIGEVAGSLSAEPHWQLAWLGVEPGQQGRGIAGALVRHVTTRADVEGVACQLFTFAPRNVPIYEHLGFRVTRDTILPSSGLRLWVMARPPFGQA